ncbi:Oligosaccharide translocation protein rft1 [Apophysomyces ossiformis]|uniref:Man(5)GlcNAc(2)-PP-dolichol translocation protein RFT1 n=1 Tax=Apophysomyces ossiformis TaxID=679940 RepID=A0A8H7BWE6_9FUNG|nr:Oligosaccharide translocation protein rft1 [Apophysomyces ossiformis]
MPQRPKSAADESNDSLLSSSARGAYYLVLLQLVSRMLTFTMHQIVIRYTSRETLGIASIKLELLLSTILFISREGFRCALLRSDTDSEKDSGKDGEQKILNLSYIPTSLGLVTTLLTCGYYLSIISEEEASTYPYYRTSVILFGVSALAELLVEPLFVLAMNRLYFRLRVSVEGIAVILRCLVTFGLTLLGATGQGNTYGVLAFALGQLVFGLTMTFGYIGYFLFGHTATSHEISLLPQKLRYANGRSYWFDKDLMNLALTMTKQSLLKHVLTEGDKMLISVLSTDKDQGEYAFAVNYGSLVARILFQPLEEAGRTFFSKILSETNNARAVKTASTVLLLILRLHVLLGLVFICFATNYTETLIDLLVGKRWSMQSNAPAVLSAYCIYVPVMGINGITEAFVQAVAGTSDLARLSYYMIAFSVCFMFAGFVFMSVMEMGAIGLVLANMVNLAIRIAYSWRFITTYFQKNGTNVTIRSWLPSPITLSGFVVSWFVTRWSKSIGWETLYEKAMHICVGACCFGIVCLIM